MLAQLESCIEDSVDPTRQHQAFTEIAGVLKNRKLTTLDNNIQWLRFLALRIKTFFEVNTDVFASRSDKGAHTVILDTIDYDTHLEELLNDKCYQIIDKNPLMTLINTERKLVKILKTNYKTKELIIKMLKVNFH